MIVIEGIDGSGKSTIAGKLAAHLGFEVVEFPVRSGTETGPKIRAMLSGAEPCDPVTLQALMLYNRLEVLDRHNLARLICVRYWQSGFVYARLDGLPDSFARAQRSAVPDPDASLLINTSPRVALARIAARDGDARETYETLDKLEKASELYRGLFPRERQINGDGTPGDTFELVISALATA